MKKFVEDNKFSFLIVSIALIFILVISFFVISYDKLIMDTMVYEFLINNFSNGYVDLFMINVTKLGNTTFVLLLTFICFMCFLFKSKKKSLSFCFLGSIGVISFINQFLKSIVKRVRPNVNRLIEIGGYSFPSGHAMVSMVLYGLLAYFCYKFIKNKVVRNIFIVINILVIFFIGISRIYLGVHYFSDVIVGFLISIIFLVLVINLMEKKIFSQN